MKELKLGFKMMKYGLQYKTMVIMFIAFFALGTLFELTSVNGNLGGLYLVILGTYMHQMIITSTVSMYVSSSPKALRLQSFIPGVYSSITMVIGFLYFTILRFVHTQAWLYLDSPVFIKSTFGGLIIVSLLAFCILIYNAIAYKYYYLGMVLLLITEIPLIMSGMNDSLDRFIPSFNNLWTYIGLGLFIIILGGAIGIFISDLLKKKPLDPKIYKSAMSRLTK